MTEDQREKEIKAVEEHGKQLVKYGDKKESLTYSKQRGISEELANKNNKEIQDLSKQFNFNNLTYHFKDDSAQKKFIGFKGLLVIYKNIMESHITLGNAEI